MGKRLRIAGMAAALLVISSSALARIGGTDEFLGIDWSEFLATALYGLLGIALAMLGYYVFELVTPWSVRKELTEDDNIAVGIVVGAMFLGVSIIVAAAIL
jgi:hypothetical protein